MQVSYSNCSLHFTEHHGLDEFHQEITGSGYSYMRPSIESAPSNARLLEVINPFANRIRFNEAFASK
jgi:hypothetical protein